MSFQTYLENIKAKTGKSAEDFRKLAAQKGFTDNGKLKQSVKAGEIVQWLKESCDGDLRFAQMKQENNQTKRLSDLPRLIFSVSETPARK